MGSIRRVQLPDTKTGIQICESVNEKRKHGLNCFRQLWVLLRKSADVFKAQVSIAGNRQQLPGSKHITPRSHTVLLHTESVSAIRWQRFSWKATDALNGTLLSDYLNGTVNGFLVADRWRSEHSLSSLRQIQDHAVEASISGAAAASR